jgi:hypothetical protein
VSRVGAAALSFAQSLVSIAKGSASGKTEQVPAPNPAPSKGKSSRGNPVQERHAHLVEVLHGGTEWRAYNPKRDTRHQLERHFGIATGRQWKRLRRRLRAQYGARVAI